MTKPELNEFVPVLDDADTMRYEDDVQNDLDRAILPLFSQRMNNLEVPGDDEEVANAVMQEAILGLMDQCFKAGVLYHARYVSAHDDSESVPVTINPAMATQMVLGLMGDEGFTMRLSVDRGQN